MQIKAKFCITELGYKNTPKNYKRWKRETIKKYMRFIKKQNAEWDHEFLIDLLYLKLTAMGEYFAMFGIHMDKKETVHEIWEARRYIKKYKNIFAVLDLNSKTPFSDKEKQEQTALDNLFINISANIQKWWD